jgi:hypothetical protein
MPESEYLHDAATAYRCAREMAWQPEESTNLRRLQEKYQYDSASSDLTGRLAAAPSVLFDETRIDYSFM